MGKRMFPSSSQVLHKETSQPMVVSKTWCPFGVELKTDKATMTPPKSGPQLTVLLTLPPKHENFPST